jgi:predicted Zn-dependent peptidase
MSDCSTSIILNLQQDYPAQIFHLDNGLTIVHQYLPTSPVVVADVWVKAGAAYEPQNCLGIAHFLEHMIFKGSARVPVGEFDRLIESQGGISNASTNHDFAHFFVATALEQFPQAFALLSDLLLHPALPAAELAAELEVVTQEWSVYADDPDAVGWESLNSLVFTGHAYANPVLGTPESLQTLTLEHLRAFHANRYQPENLTVAIVGGIDQESALAVVNRYCQGFPAVQPLEISRGRVHLPSDRQHQHLQMPQVRGARLLMGWATPGCDQLADDYGLDLLSVILAGSQTAILVRQLREETQLVYDVAAHFSLQQEAGLFSINAILEPELLGRVEQLILNKINQIQEHGITAAQLQRAKRLLINQHHLSLETPQQLAGLYGYYGTIACAEVAATYVPTIEEVTEQDIQRLACTYLDTSRYSIITISSNPES